jgi:hypothetical protein
MWDRPALAEDRLTRRRWGLPEREEAAMAVDETKLNAFLGQFVQDLGATVQAGMVVLGHRLGLYRAMAGAGPLSPAELAERTGTAERYVREWLAAQASAGYLAYDPASGRFSLPEEQAFALADPAGPVYLPGAFQLALASLKAEPRLAEAFRTGAGVGWHEQDDEVFDGCEMFFAPGYRANLVQSWIPALDGVEAKLRAGARVADAGVSDRARFEFSVLLCVPNALSQQPTAVLGNQAGEARTRELVAAGGFGRFRRAAETPFNLVYEARP